MPSEADAPQADALLDTGVEGAQHTNAEPTMAGRGAHMSRDTIDPAAAGFTRRDGVDFLCSYCDTFFTVGRAPNKQDFERFPPREMVRIIRSEDGISFVDQTDDDLILCSKCFLDYVESGQADH